MFHLYVHLIFHSIFLHILDPHRYHQILPLQLMRQDFYLQGKSVLNLSCSAHLRIGIHHFKDQYQLGCSLHLDLLDSCHKRHSNSSWICYPQEWDHIPQVKDLQLCAHRKQYDKKYLALHQRKCLKRRINWMVKHSCKN